MTKNGLHEEIDVANFFSKLGYFTRFHIQIYPEVGNKGQISDIDVFTIKFDNLLLPTRNIVETKRGTDKVSALFQLYGFKQYFEDCNVFFVNKRTSHRNFNVANKLNIKAYSFNRLRQITKNYPKYRTINLTYDNGQKLLKFLERVKKINSTLYWDYHYLWIETNPFKKLNDIQEMFKITDEIYNKFCQEKAFLWFRRELFLMAFLSVIEISSKCIALDNYYINNYIEDQFYNLGTSKKRKFEIKEAVDSLLGIIKENLGEDVDLTLDLIPSWIDLLTKIIKKIVFNAKYANVFLLINENVHKSYATGKPQNIAYFTANESEKKMISSINTDLLKILHREHVKKDFNHFL